ncbi:hypothetical protein Zmor_026174 [Zophobas morio]|uniref:Uncharacterized protein n=1 Tax=Zophobas morio TaxID=2755281 RepID=A0AA38M559_9CUCU|nr:hypothetical protein Zmor_026174 [Zophobas morio]
MLTVLLRNKPIRRPGTTPVGFLVCAAMMADSSSVTAAGRRSLKKSLEAEVAMGIPERPRSGNFWKESMGLNEDYYSVSESNPVNEFSQVAPELFCT